MKKFKKILKEGNPKKIKKFVQKKMDKIERLEFLLEELSDYTFELEQNYYDLERQMMYEANPEETDKEKESEINPEDMEEKPCCNENCCKKD